MTTVARQGPLGRDRGGLAYLGAALAGVVAIVAVEALLVLPGHLLAAQIIDAVLVFALVNAGPRHATDAPSARTSAALAALRALALVPLSRVVALGLPMRDWSEPLAVIAIALPIGVVALRLTPIVGLSLRRLFSPRMSLPDLYAVLAGVVLGLLAFTAGAPALWPDGAADDRIALALAAAALAATVEELVFRGLVQGTLQRAFGRLGLLAAVALFAATYLDAGSAALVLTIALAGVVFSHAAATSGALVGVIVGHVLLVVGAGGLWPALIEESALPQLREPATTIGLSIAIAVAIVLAVWHPLTRRSDEDEAAA